MIPKEKHIVTNEDRIKSDHPGYRFNKCSKCGIVYIVGNNYQTEVEHCGRKSCGGDISEVGAIVT